MGEEKGEIGEGHWLIPGNTNTFFFLENNLVRIRELDV